MLQLSLGVMCCQCLTKCVDIELHCMLLVMPSHLTLTVFKNAKISLA